jgi:vacuolar-type H+-ATPase catalytic subunit A/Vma1
MAELYAEGEFDLVDVSGMDTTSQNQSDAEEINSVADAFMNRGMEAGREAYSMVDTMVQEDMDEYLDGQGFNVDADIHAEYQKDVDRYNDSPAGQADKDQQAQQDAEWEEDLPTWRAAQVEIAAVNPKNQSSVLHSVQFDARKYNSSVGELKSTLEQQLSKIKQGKSDAVIRITLGGKPTDMQGILDQFKQIDNKTTQDSDVTEGALASMKRLAGIAPVQTSATPGQRQYRHMPTAVQPR